MKWRLLELRGIPQCLGVGCEKQQCVIPADSTPEALLVVALLSKFLPSVIAAMVGVKEALNVFARAILVSVCGAFYKLQVK